MYNFTAAGQEGDARQHMHEPKLRERTVGEGAQVMNKPGDHQTFDPNTARHTYGQGENLGSFRTDTTGRPKEEQPYAPKNTPVGMMHSGGGHSTSTGDLDIGKKGAHVKLGSIGVERDPQAPGEDRHPANYQAKVTDPTATGKIVSQIVCNFMFYTTIKPYSANLVSCGLFILLQSMLDPQ